MNKLVGYLLILSVIPVLSPVVALADKQAKKTLTVEHFSYKAQLEGGTSSLRQLELPKVVLQGMARGDLGDLRVFNADGQVVPHQFKQSVIQQKRQKSALVFYPFSKEQAADPASIRIHIEQSEGKQNVDVSSQYAQEKKTQQEFQYIIENAISQRDAKKQLCSLKLDWQQPKVSMILPLRIESSNDLQSWSLLSANQNISRLDFNGSQLIHSQLDLPCSSARYLRIQWLNPKQGIHLTGIEGNYHQKGSKKMQWDSLGVPVINEKGEWLFENTSVAPLSRLSFVAPMDGLLYKGQLYSRNNPKAKWKVQQQIIQYRLKMQNTQLSSRPLELYNNKDKYWKVVLTSESYFSQNQLPEIRASRQQQQLIYLAQGSEPYTLAYGNTEIRPTTDSGINQLIQSLYAVGSSPDQVSLGGIVTNTEKLVVSHDVPWKIIGLWILLLLGTGIMGYMAYSLYRQMNKNVEDSGSS